MRAGVAVLGVLLLASGCAGMPGHGMVPVPARTKVTPISATAFAKPCDHVREMERDLLDRGDLAATIVAAMCWIERNTDYRNIAPPREVAEVDPEFFASVSRVKGYTAGTTTAAYNCLNRTLYLSEGWSYRTLGPQAVLIHELVHHAQCVTNRWWAMRTSCARERDAYWIQVRFLRFMADKGKGFTDEQRQRIRAGAEQVDKDIDKVCEMLGDRP